MRSRGQKNEGEYSKMDDIVHYTLLKHNRQERRAHASAADDYDSA